MIPPVRSADEHRFAALCALLTFHHPRVGAGHLAVNRSEQIPYRKGWNVTRARPGRTRPLWTFIDEQGGRTTPNKPDVDDADVHVVDAEPAPLPETTAWHWLTQLAATHHDTAWAMSIVEQVRDADRLEFPYDPEAEHAGVSTALGALSERAASFKGADDLARHIVDAMRPNMSFRLPGNVAAPVLAAVLASLAESAEAGEPIESMIELRETLGERLVGLLDLRRGMAPGSVEHVSLLASLYGHVALVLSDLIRDRYDMPASRRTLLARWDQNVDELLAHQVLPYFVWFAIPSVERSLRLSSATWDSLSETYGDVKSPRFDFDALDFAEHGPCSLDFLKRAAAGFLATSRAR